MKRFVYFLFAFTLIFSACKEKKAKEEKWEIKSPDGKISVIVQNNLKDSVKKLSYQVYFINEKDTTIVIEPSGLGIDREDKQFSENLKFVEISDNKVIDEKYTLVAGKRLKNHSYANEKTIRFKHADGETLEIIFRAYNDGIAYRYHFPKKSDSTFTIVKEYSSFNFPEEGEIWIQPYDTIATWAPAYEYGYVKDVKIGDEPPMTTGWAFPALFHTNDMWTLITESAVYEDYCGSHLSANCKGGDYKIEFPWKWENYGLGEANPSNSLPWKTPWRLAIIGKTPANIVESNLVFHLAKPNQLEDTSWIEPGVSSWSWWGDHTSGKNFKKLKDYIDLAKEMGWEYSLVDADWHIMEGGEIEDLVAYANTNDVGILMWYNSAGPHTKVMNAGPRDLMHKPQVRQNELEKISRWGVKGIKVDFFQSDKQSMIKLYMDIARDAAKNKILLNTHGCTLPRGWGRTYPNFITMEAVRGAELYGYHKFPPRAVWLNSVYPFTRNVVGSMDYTPVTFTDYQPESAHLTSYAHELALSVVFESGIQHFADRIEGFKALPEKPLKFLKNVPVAWDDTYFVSGYPGKHIIIARKKGDKIYIGGINGELTEKDVEFTLSFLPDGKYSLELISDGENEKSFATKTIEVDNSTPVKVHMLKAGGFTGIIQ